MINPKTTKLKLGQCPRCGRYVLASLCAGLKRAVDPGALPDIPAYIAALTEGRTTFELLEQAGRPWKLEPRTPASEAPRQGSQGLTGALGRPVVVEHGCGAHAMDAALFEETPPDPPSAPATPGSNRAGHRPGPAHVAGANPISPAPPATPRRSEIEKHAGRDGKPKPGHVIPPGQPKCDRCGYRIDYGEPFTGLHHVTWQWAYHDGTCPHEQKEA